MAQPGLPNQDRIRSGSRIAGLILTAVGVIMLIGGFIGFVVSGFGEVAGDADPFQDDGMPTPVYWFLVFGAGMLLTALGRPLLAAGFGGVALRYGAGEAMPVVKDSLDYLRHGSAEQEQARGPFCRSCGVRNDEAARFCDACGAGLG